MEAMDNQLMSEIRLEEVGVVDFREVLVRHETKVFATRDPRKLKGIVFHHSAMDGNDKQAMQAIAKYHVGPNHVSSTGAPGALYTLAILGDGTVLLLNDLNLATWSQGDRSKPGDENANYLSCLVLGNFDSPTNRTGLHPTPAQFLSVLKLIRATQRMWGWGDGDVYGHCDFGKAACPGASLESLILAIRSNAHVRRDWSSTKARQQALVDMGEHLTVDGVWGPASRKALASFQSQVGLVADGQWGPKTQAAMEKAIEALEA